MAENLTHTTDVAVAAPAVTGWQVVINRLSGYSKTFYALVALSAFILAAGLAAGLHAMYIGYDHAYNTTREIPWGILISTYVFFVVTSTGLCLVSSIGHVFGVKDLCPLRRERCFSRS